MSLRNIPYEKPMPAFKASIANLFRRLAELFDEISPDTAFGGEFRNVIGDKLKSFMDLINAVYATNHCDNPTAINYTISRKVWKNQYIIRNRRFKNGHLFLYSNYKDSDTVNIVTIVDILITKLRCAHEMLKGQRLQSDFTIELTVQLDKILSTIPPTETEIKLVKDKKYDNYEDYDNNQNDDTEIKMIEKQVEFEPFVNDIKNAFSAARDAHLIAKEKSYNELKEKEIKEKNEGWEKAGKDKASKKKY